MAWPTDQDPDRRPFTVGPGEEIDFPELLGGFTSLEPPAAQPDPEGTADPDGDTAPAAPLKTARKSAATKTQGGEPS
jgi:hypothetical protein